MSRRNAQRFLYEEFTLKDRRELDDATLEILGIEDSDDRTELRERVYRDVTAMQRATRDREIIAQRDGRRAARRGITTPHDLADELWAEHGATFDLLEFPDDFVQRRNEGDLVDLPRGEVEVGAALVDEGDLLRAGTIRVGGQDGEVMDVGSVARARFLEALAKCYRAGQDALSCAATNAKWPATSPVPIVKVSLWRSSLRLFLVNTAGPKLGSIRSMSRKHR